MAKKYSSNDEWDAPGKEWDAPGEEYDAPSPARETDLETYRSSSRSPEQINRRRLDRKKRERKQRTIFISLILIAVIAAALVLFFIFQSNMSTISFLWGKNGGNVQNASAIKQTDSVSAPDDSPTGSQNSEDPQAGSADENTVSTDASGNAPANASGNASADASGNASADASGQPASAAPPAETDSAPAAAESTDAAASDQAVLDQASLLAAGYDYDAAIALLQGLDNYESNQAATAAVAEYSDLKASCTAVDVNTVPHIFYHSLLNDTGRAFNYETLGTSTVDGMNAWMTTVGEFDEITQRLYDAGYVYVRLRDLVVQTRDEDGTVHFTPNTSLMLPPGKKPIVLSIDDLSYYHSYEPAGFPDKLVLDENGQVKCHYVDASGNESIGDYDVVPRLNSFLAEHPDGSYHGARGLIAMTGYNGVFGYRTDSDYVLQENLMDDQRKWLDEHPDFNIEEEIAQAVEIANALKDEGWEFASHTWGHLSVTGKSAEALQTDNEKWVNTVQNIVGPVDTIIFAHGNDIGDWQGYSDDNPQYQYYNSAGYHFYCNVDSSTPYWVQITDRYVRQGRIDVDGYRLYEGQLGNDNSLAKLIDVTGIFDPSRPTPVNANGME